MTDRDALLRELFAPVRSLEPSEREISAVLDRIPRRDARSLPRLRPARRAAVTVLATLALLAGGAYAVPVTRAALEDAAGEVASVFDGWLGGEATEAPGRALRTGEDVPGYFRDGAWAVRHVREPRVLAQAGGYKLFAYRERGGTIGFDLGDTGVGMGGLTAAHFRDHVLFVLGPGAMPGPDEHGHIPWFGLAARVVTRIEVSYESGPPLRVDGVDGAFVLLVEPGRGPREVVAFDAGGEIVDRQSIADAY